MQVQPQRPPELLARYAARPDRYDELCQRIGSVGTGQLAGGQRQHGAHPFAAAQKAVARGLPQLRPLWQVFIAQRG